MDAAAIALWEWARKEGKFVDPTRVRSVTAEVRALPAAWVAAQFEKAGHPAPARLNWRDCLYLVAAAQAAPGEVAAYAEHERARRAQAQAAAAVEAARERELQQAANAEVIAMLGQLPVPVEVMHHYSRHHYEGGNPDRDHIVVTDELRRGRLTRRPGQALCETDSHQLPHKHPKPAAVPTCKACLKVAATLIAQS